MDIETFSKHLVAVSNSEMQTHAVLGAAYEVHAFRLLFTMDAHELVSDHG